MAPTSWMARAAATRSSYVASDAGVTVSLSSGLGSGGHAQGDTLFFIENVVGSKFDDTIEGNAGNNVLTGGAHGTDGDTVSYANALASVTVSLTTTKAQNTYGAGKDTLTGFQNLTGSDFADKLTGSAANNLLSGGDGNDIIYGGAGADTLIGGTGADLFVFKATSESTLTGYDVVADFQSGVDSIDLSAIDANKSAKGDQSFQFGGRKRSGKAQIRHLVRRRREYDRASRRRREFRQDLKIALVGLGLSLTATDFVL